MLTFESREPLSIKKLASNGFLEDTSIPINEDGSLAFDPHTRLEFMFSYGSCKCLAEIEKTSSSPASHLVITLTFWFGVIPYTSEDAKRRGAILAALKGIADYSVAVTPQQNVYFQTSLSLLPPFTNTSFVAGACAVVINNLPRIRSLQAILQK